MSNSVSALNGENVKGFVQVSELGLQGMITLRANLSTPKVKKAIKDVTGVMVPKIRQILHDGDNSIGWMSPDELLILCPHSGAEAMVTALHDALGKTHALVINVSDARAMFAVKGADARDAMAKLAPTDFGMGFQPGEIRRSRLAQVAGAFWMVDQETFNVVCFRSVARYMFDVLAVSAEKGGEVGYF
ncbi:MAG: sarcosine oxidase subunit gamma family protein [Paracoccaceae bacterium]|nr:sarcosine oxidase subunit gamma family protein [Paracoccaceae bacterium]